MAHDFTRFPDLTTNQMQFYYFESPHRQITEDFWGRCVEVHDGDTAHIKWSERDELVRVRFAGVDAPELNEPRGHESRDWMKNRIEGRYVHVALEPERTDKFGRILGRVFEAGSDVGLELIAFGYAEVFA